MNIACIENKQLVGRGNGHLDIKDTRNRREKRQAAMRNRRYQISKYEDQEIKGVDKKKTLLLKFCFAHISYL